MIDLNVESIVYLNDAARMLPTSNGRGLHTATLLRWIHDGRKAADGSTLRLEAIRVGGRWGTSKEALARFFDGLTLAGCQRQAATAGSQLTKARQREVERAEREAIALLGG